MKTKIKDFFRPNAFKIVALVAFVSWEFFYSFQNYNLFFSRDILNYLKNGIGVIGWGNFFVKNLSLMGVWFLLAVVIYIAILGYETVINAIHNAQVKRTYANQKEEDITHLLKSREIFLKTHLLTYLLWTGAIILVFVGFLFVSNLIESLRFTFSDFLFWQLLEGGVEVDYSNVPLLVGSFFVTLPAWYLYVCGINWVISEGRYEEEKDKITEDHFAVVVDNEAEIEN